MKDENLRKLMKDFKIASVLLLEKDSENIELKEWKKKATEQLGVCRSLLNLMNSQPADILTLRIELIDELLEESK